VLCTTVVHNDVHMREQFLHFCMLGLDFYLCGRGERLRNDVFCVELDVKLQLSQPSVVVLLLS